MTADITRDDDGSDVGGENGSEDLSLAACRRLAAAYRPDVDYLEVLRAVLRQRRPAAPLPQKA